MSQSIMQNILHLILERQELICFKSYNVSFPLTRVEQGLCSCGRTHKAKQSRLLQQHGWAQPGGSANWQPDFLVPLS